MAVIDFTGIYVRAAFPRRASEKIGRHAQESPRLDVIFKLDFGIQGVKDARPVLLPIEKINLPAERCAKAPSDQRGSWIGLGQFDRVDIQHATSPKNWTTPIRR
jgi:hypothetical protein